MSENDLYYHNSIELVMIGDRISFKKLFKTVEGEVVYIPGQSRNNHFLGDDVWAIKLDDEPNDIRIMGFSPKEDKYAIKKISLIKRGGGFNEITPGEEIL